MKFPVVLFDNNVLIVVTIKFHSFLLVSYQPFSLCHEIIVNSQSSEQTSMLQLSRPTKYMTEENNVALKKVSSGGASNGVGCWY